MKIRLFFQLQIFVCLMWQVSYGQSLLDSSIILSPDGIFDLVSDRYNNQYALSNLQIGTGKPINGGNTTSSISGTCNAGYFKLHFEAGSIFDQIPSAQNLICQVYSDISNFINSNALAGSINIQCRNTLTSSDLGRASSFFVYPSVTNTINCNILDGQVYKYLVSGSDPYIGVPGTFINAGNFYHGYVEANPFLTNTIIAVTNSAITSPTYILNPGGISQNVPSFVVTPTAQTIYTLTTIGSGTLSATTTSLIGTNLWNFATTGSTIAANEFDFYTVMLHEAMHTLGIVSFINYNGYPLLSNSGSYSRYDLFLRDYNNIPLLTTGTLCPASSYSFAPGFLSTSAASVVGAAVQPTTTISDNTTCSLAAQFVGTSTFNVYTPDYYETGASLAHFEDICSGNYTGTCTSSPGNNNLYFVMANFLGSGSCFVKRFLKDEERNVLCDLGYTVSANYGSSVVPGSIKNYSTGTCSPTITVYGNNDGMSGNTYTLSTIGSSTVINHSTILNNDLPVGGLTVTCLSLVSGNATVSPGSSDFTVQAAAGSGVVILQYFPMDISSGTYGNPTYITIYFTPPGCASCGIINNGGFEFSQATTTNSACGEIGQFNTLDCWNQYYSSGARLCATTCTGSNLQLGVYTLGTSPPVNTLNIGSATNNQCVGLFYPNSSMNGVLKNNLNTPLINANTYQISFWVLNQGSTSTSTLINGPNNPIVLTVASHTSTAITPTANFPTGLTNTLGQFTINASSNWALVTNTFVYSGNSSAQAVIVGIDVLQTTPPVTSGSGAFQYLCFLDEFSIVPYPDVNFSIQNSTLCTNQSLTDLSLYTGTTSGTFSGAGVTYNSTTGKYEFNTAGFLNPGVYPIAFTYTNIPNTCLNTINEAITVINCCNNPAIQTLTPTTITGTPVYLGPMRFLNSFTITGSMFLNGEFLISQGVSITVANGGQLNLVGAHLYGCVDMWEGINVLDGGKVIMQVYNNVGNMIEDAETAIQVSNNTSSGTVLDISSTVFNKNYIDIDLSSCPSSSFVIHSNVFTSRNFTFTSTSWPQASLTDLRSTTGGTNVLHGPYELQSQPLATLKSPRLGEYSRTAIWMSSVGTTAGTYPSLTFNSARVGLTPATNPENYFNLFDCHRNFIEAHNSNLRLVNNVFQNTIAFANTVLKLAMINFSATTSDKSLDMLAAQPNVGNRFYDFHEGIHAINACDFKVENAVFRSSDGVGTSPMATNWIWGKDAISAQSSAFRNYIISNNEFNNIHYSIVLGTAGGTVNSIAIQSNTFSPTLGISSTSTLVNLLNRPIGLSTPFQVYSPAGSNGINISNNVIYRAANGIWVNGFSLQGSGGACGEQLSIENNSVLLEEVSYAPIQQGIAITNNLPLYSGTGCPWPSAGAAGFRPIASNTVSLFNGNLSSTKIAMFHTFNSAGVSVPPLFMTCNEASDAHEGFAFEGWQQGVYWRGNKMDNLGRGMILKNGGVIGQQGTQAGAPSDNEWLISSFTSTNYGIYTSASQATNSPIIRRTTPSQFDPPNLDGSPSNDSYLFGGLVTYTGSSTFSCGANYTQMPTIALPNEQD
jgi:hypothetical protein